MTIGEKIIKERKRQGLTQQALADMCSVTKRTIASYETDGRIPHASTLRKIALALGCTTDYLADDSILELQAPTEEQIYIHGLREAYGDTTADEIESLIAKNVSLFAGGMLDQDAKDKYFLALTNAYIACKKAGERTGD
ncbi:MAG: helix-turn-helix transcriptional regulator [Eubacteriales bacterium]|nr:helix-turn-helix transcriptional regulator [Eubacteriales bacterium]